VHHIVAIQFRVIRNIIRNLKNASQAALAKAVFGSI